MSIKFQIWLRLVAIALSVATGEYLPAMIALLAPIPEMWTYSLGVKSKALPGEEEDEEEEDEEEKDADTEEEKGEDEEDEEDTKADKATKALLAKVRKAAATEVAKNISAWNKEGEKKVKKLIDQKMLAFKGIEPDQLKRALDEYDKVNETLATLKAAQKSGAEKKKEIFLVQKLKEHFPEIKKQILEQGAKNYKFTLEETKAPNLVNAASFADRVIFGFREAGVTFAALPELFILDLIQVMTGGPGSNPLSWIERNVHTQAGPPAVVANPTGVLESAQKPQLGYLWVENKISAETISAIVPVTKQAIFNYPMLEQEVRFELMRRLAYVLQEYIINGTGTPPQLKGINTYATAFAAGIFALAVNLANEYDVLVAAATQILNSNYVPTAALVSHNSKGQMTLAKDANGQYILPPFASADGLNVFGMKIIGTNHMPTDQFIAGDFTKSLFNWVENITIEIGMINDDFEKNQWRIRGELQGMHRIKEHEKLAFVKGDFSVAKAAMETA